jgi:excisionase family DNA binding protein
MSAAEVAAALHISRQTVHRYIREGRLRARTIKTGKRGTYQIRRSDFLAFVKRYVRDDWA